MNESKASTTALSAGDAARLEELPRPPEGASGASKAVPSPPSITAPSGWTARRITALVIGSLLGLISLGLLGGAGTAFWADWTQRDAGYFTTGIYEFATDGSALVTEPTQLGSAGVGWLYAPGLLDKVRIRVTPLSSDSTLFVGIGPSGQVDRYLAGVSHTVISDFWGARMANVGGGTAASAPGAQDFWAASSSGAGARTVVWKPSNGSWSVVVMNADGRPGMDVGADLGAHLPALLWIGVALLVFGAVFAAAGTFLIVGAIRRRRTARA